MWLNCQEWAVCIATRHRQGTRRRRCGITCCSGSPEAGDGQRTSSKVSGDDSSRRCLPSCRRTATRPPPRATRSSRFPTDCCRGRWLRTPTLRRRTTRAVSRAYTQAWNLGQIHFGKDVRATKNTRKNMAFMSQVRAAGPPRSHSLLPRGGDAENRLRSRRRATTAWCRSKSRRTRSWRSGRPTRPLSARPCRGRRPGPCLRSPPSSSALGHLEGGFGERARS